MYSEEVKYLPYKLNESTHANKTRNAYFKNRNCVINVLDFLDQEVVIMTSSYFSYPGGIAHSMIDGYIGVYDHVDYEFSDEASTDILVDSLGRQLWLSFKYFRQLFNCCSK
jgi:hypothetical protein